MGAFYIIYSVLLFAVLTLVGVLVFYAINKVTYAQWSSHLYPVMQQITTPLYPMLLLLLGMLYTLNKEPYFLLRSVGYMALWAGYRYFLSKEGVQQAKTITFHTLFLVFFFLTETPMAWDWLLSFTPHWHSTLFAWQLLSAFLLSGVALITLFSSPSHYHDLGKYLFGFSIFWAYLWFSQYMLIWYANIPEETAYYQILFGKGYSTMVVVMLLLSFALPFLALLSSQAKQKKAVLFGTAIAILLGQYLNFYLMIIPFTSRLTQ